MSLTSTDFSVPPARPAIASPSLDAALREGPNTLLPPKLAAPILRHSISALNRWRARGTGPDWVKLSRSRVAYRAQDLLDYINAKKQLAA